MNKKKKSTNIFPYPDEAIERLARAFYPAILVCWNSEEGQREFAVWQTEQAHHTNKEKQEVPTTKLTVFFEAPFWIGVFERIERRKLSVCKVVFGAEPKDYEVWEYLLKNYSRLRFSPSVETVVKKESVNPKRLQRQIRKETAATGIGTKSQQALQMQREENKLVRKALSRKQREAEKQRQFELKQQKRKEKHRGR